MNNEDPAFSLLREEFKKGDCCNYNYQCYSFGEKCLFYDLCQFRPDWEGAYDEQRAALERVFRNNNDENGQQGGL